MATREEGRRIAQRLGQGVTYRGPWLPYGPKGEFLGHFFQDDAVTGTSFVAKTFEEAKHALIDIRKKFGAKPPVFANNPGNISITKDEWNNVYFAALPLVGIVVSALGVTVGLLALKRSQAEAVGVGSLETSGYTALNVNIPKVQYNDGQVLVEVRSPGEWHDIREFVQPLNPDVVNTVSRALYG